MSCFPGFHSWPPKDEGKPFPDSNSNSCLRQVECRNCTKTRVVGTAHRWETISRDRTGAHQYSGHYEQVRKRCSVCGATCEVSQLVGYQGGD